jgi:ArsR family transcriptional regulator
MAIKARPKAHYEARARVAKALAHPSRLLMMDVLARDELCVSDLTELVGADQSTVSKHLGVLRNAGLVEQRKEGSQAFYRMKVPCLEGFWGCIETVLSKNLNEQKKAL